MQSLPRILCVDDEPNVLHGLRRILYQDFDVTTATSGHAGLNNLEDSGEFAVIVSDMRMPEMNGAQFLAKAQDIQPDATRVLLTGQADLNSAIAAVNEGNIFRFLTKPCPENTLSRVLNDSVRQFELLRMEKDLLERTLKGTVNMLTEVLSLAAPAAFARASLIQGFVSHMATKFGVDDLWKFELAAMMSRIGCITLPSETMAKLYAGQRLSEEETALHQNHPKTGHDLLAQIPRFEEVAEMVRRQSDPCDGCTVSGDVALGAGMIRTAAAVDERIMRGSSIADAVADLRYKPGMEPKLLDLLADFRRDASFSDVVRSVKVSELQPFMILDEDVKSTSGQVIVKRGREVNGVLIQRLLNFSHGAGIQEPFRVRVVV